MGAVLRFCALVLRALLNVNSPWVMCVPYALIFRSGHQWEYSACISEIS